MSLLDGNPEELLFSSRSIGSFKADATIEEISRDVLEITEHPVERGATITDHAYLKPSNVTINAVFISFVTPLSEIYSKLLELQSSRVPFKITTGKRTYTNMLFKSLSQTTDRNTENVLSINADFQQIIIVDSKTTDLPPNLLQSNAEVTGGTVDVGDKKAQETDLNDQQSSQLLQLAEA